MPVQKPLLCYENHYTNCSRCGRLLRESDAYFEDDTPYCDDCHAEYRNSKPIRDYPAVKRTEEHDGPGMFFYEDYADGKIPDYLIYVPGHEKPGKGPFQERVV